MTPVPVCWERSFYYMFKAGKTDMDVLICLPWGIGLA